MKTNTVVTVYNKYYSPATKAEVYKRTVIGRAHWENRKAKNVLASGGDLAANQAQVYVPMRGATDGYLNPKAWLALTDKTGFWTIAQGDVMVKGEVVDEVSSSLTVTALKAKYDDVLEVKSVDTMDYGSVSLHHWKVGLK